MVHWDITVIFCLCTPVLHGPLKYHRYILPVYLWSSWSTEISPLYFACVPLFFMVHWNITAIFCLCTPVLHAPLKCHRYILPVYPYSSCSTEISPLYFTCVPLFFMVHWNITVIFCLCTPVLHAPLKYHRYILHVYPCSSCSTEISSLYFACVPLFFMLHWNITVIFCLCTPVLHGPLKYHRYILPVYPCSSWSTEISPLYFACVPLFFMLHWNITVIFCLCTPVLHGPLKYHRYILPVYPCSSCSTEISPLYFACVPLFFMLHWNIIVIFCLCTPVLHGPLKYHRYILPVYPCSSWSTEISPLYFACVPLFFMLHWNITAILCMCTPVLHAPLKYHRYILPVYPCSSWSTEISPLYFACVPLFFMVHWNITVIFCLCTPVLHAPLKYHRYILPVYPCSSWSTEISPLYFACVPLFFMLHWNITAIFCMCTPVLHAPLKYNRYILPVYPYSSCSTEISPLYFACVPLFFMVHWNITVIFCLCTPVLHGPLKYHRYILPVYPCSSCSTEISPLYFACVPLFFMLHWNIIVIFCLCTPILHAPLKYHRYILPVYPCSTWSTEISPLYFACVPLFFMVHWNITVIFCMCTPVLHAPLKYHRYILPVYPCSSCSTEISPLYFACVPLFFMVHWNITVIFCLCTPVLHGPLKYHRYILPVYPCSSWSTEISPLYFACVPLFFMVHWNITVIFCMCTPVLHGPLKYHRYILHVYPCSSWSTEISPLYFACVPLFFMLHWNITVIFCMCIPVLHAPLKYHRYILPVYPCSSWSTEISPLYFACVPLFFMVHWNITVIFCLCTPVLHAPLKYHRYILHVYPCSSCSTEISPLYFACVPLFFMVHWNITAIFCLCTPVLHGPLKYHRYILLVYPCSSCSTEISPLYFACVPLFFMVHWNITVIFCLCTPVLHAPLKYHRYILHVYPCSSCSTEISSLYFACVPLFFMLHWNITVIFCLCTPVLHGPLKYHRYILPVYPCSSWSTEISPLYFACVPLFFMLHWNITAIFCMCTPVLHAPLKYHRYILPVYPYSSCSTEISPLYFACVPLFFMLHWNITAIFCMCTPVLHAPLKYHRYILPVYPYSSCSTEISPLYFACVPLFFMVHWNITVIFCLCTPVLHGPLKYHRYILPVYPCSSCSTEISPLYFACVPLFFMLHWNITVIFCLCTPVLHGPLKYHRYILPVYPCSSCSTEISPLYFACVPLFFMVHWNIIVIFCLCTPILHAPLKYHRYILPVYPCSSWSTEISPLYFACVPLFFMLHWNITAIFCMCTPVLHAPLKYHRYILPVYPYSSCSTEISPLYFACVPLFFMVHWNITVIFCLCTPVLHAPLKYHRYILPVYPCSSCSTEISPLYFACVPLFFMLHWNIIVIFCLCTPVLHGPLKYHRYILPVYPCSSWSTEISPLYFACVPLFFMLHWNITVIFCLCTPVLHGPLKYHRYILPVYPCSSWSTEISPLYFACVPLFFMLHWNITVIFCLCTPNCHMH